MKKQVEPSTNAVESRQDYCERFEPNYTQGLNAQQVQMRQQQGLSNDSGEIKTKTVGQIIRGNLITPFNILNVILASMVFLVGSYKNLLFMGVVICNTLIGTLQEIRAKKTIDKLAPGGGYCFYANFLGAPDNEKVLRKNAWVRETVREYGAHYYG